MWFYVRGRGLIARDEDDLCSRTMRRYYPVIGTFEPNVSKLLRVAGWNRI